MGARPRSTQKRRTQMLEAAMEVIVERGLCETRIADVAERADLSPALVVYYFGSKETLLTEALAYAEDLFYIEAFRELTGIEGATERMVRLIDLACPPVVRRESDEYWTLWVELWSRALRNDEAARKREALERRWRNTIAEVVREGQRSGEFGPCDPERFATYLSALMDGLALQVLFGDPAVDGELVNEMCLEAAAGELGFDTVAHGGRDEEGGAGQEELAAEG
jgi:AcrR family transcriptional regulator